MTELETAVILNILQSGELEVAGLLPWSSNYTFMVQVCGSEVNGNPVALSAVYKPRRGERPLWDFAQGTLCLRERAAFLVSNAIGWEIVPPTVLRKASQGLGSIQFFIEHDPEHHYFTFEGEPAYRTQLQKIVLFDILINNADRKSGHILLQENLADSVHLWGIDHGICFHEEYKLRTVIWEFVGQPIPANLLRDLIHMQTVLETNGSELTEQLKELLSPAEIAAMKRRVNHLIRQGMFPTPGPGRHYPWPPV